MTSAVRPDVAHNGEIRPLYWSNKRVVAAIDAYLTWRATHRQGRTIKRDAYRALDPDIPLFLTEDGQPYSLTKRMLPSGVLSYCATHWAPTSRACTRTPESKAAAPQAPGARWRSNFTARAMYDLVHIAALLGHKSVSTTKRLVSQDPVRLADIVARAI